MEAQVKFNPPRGLLAQVVPSHPGDFQLRGSSPCINTYPAKKKKKVKFNPSSAKSWNNHGSTIVMQ